MSAFKEFWKNAAYYGNPEKRMEQIEGMMTEIDKEIQSVVDPTRWRKLLDQKEALGQEMLGLGHAPLRME